MGTLLGLVTWMVIITSASEKGRLSLSEVSFMETKWKIGSLGTEDSIADVATAVAAPTTAELQLKLILYV